MDGREIWELSEIQDLGTSTQNCSPECTIERVNYWFLKE